MMEISGWGRYPRYPTEWLAPSSPEGVTEIMRERSGLVARGCGRAYGDAAIGPRATLSSGRLDRVRAFDRASRRITVEAGVTLRDLVDLTMPAGLFPPVVPGTQNVSVGGMIASDVHGKNHHRDGGFGDHVESLTLVLPDGRRAECSAEADPDLFWATVGGMGLTGTILEASLRLRPIETGWMRQTTEVAPHLAGAVAALDRADASTYAVAWIDCLARGAAMGRSLVYAAEHASLGELTAAMPSAPRYPGRAGRRLSVPLDAPPLLLNRLSVGAFNALYYRAGARSAGAARLVPWEPFFFPLDGIGHWNRLYGRRGFLQYQCVLPLETAADALAELLERVSRSGAASFLAVLKRLGAARGMLSFPLEGYTLAIDMPVSVDVLRLLDDLDEIVVEGRGRIYLAKDARQSRATFEAGYPGLARFRETRRAIGAVGRVASRLSKRLGIE